MTSMLFPLLLAATLPAAEPSAAATDFIETLRPLCGQAFEGEVITDTPATPGPNPFAARPIVMHLRECGEDTVRIPLHLGEDRSRTWVITRTATGLRLKHDHRHPDGEPDTLTLYGGNSAPGADAKRVDFPADAESQALFQREGRSVSMQNTWTLEHRVGESFHYRLQRPEGRRFELRFDLRRPVTPPLPPWGASD